MINNNIIPAKEGTLINIAFVFLYIFVDWSHTWNNAVFFCPKKYAVRYKPGTYQS